MSLSLRSPTAGSPTVNSLAAGGHAIRGKKARRPLPLSLGAECKSQPPQQQHAPVHDVAGAGWDLLDSPVKTEPAPRKGSAQRRGGASAGPKRRPLSRGAPAAYAVKKRPEGSTPDKVPAPFVQLSMEAQIERSHGITGGPISSHELRGQPAAPMLHESSHGSLPVAASHRQLISGG